MIKTADLDSTKTLCFRCANCMCIEIQVPDPPQMMMGPGGMRQVPGVGSTIQHQAICLVKNGKMVMNTAVPVLKCTEYEERADKIKLRFPGDVEENGSGELKKESSRISLT